MAHRLRQDFARLDRCNPAHNTTSLADAARARRHAETEVMIATEAYKAARAQLEQAWARRQAARIAEKRAKRATRMRRKRP